MTAKDRKYPWQITKERKKFFVPTLDIEGTKLEGLKAALPHCLYGKPCAEAVIYKGKLGVMFWLRPFPARF